MARSFGLVDYKVQEAEFFLRETERLGDEFNFSGVQFCAAAFASSARSVTFAMQSSLKGLAEFDRWYEKRQEELRGNTLARFFNDFRRVTQHIGESVVSAGVSGPEGPLYYFMPCDEIKAVPDDDVVTACKAYFVLVLQLVYDCYLEFARIVDGQQYFTKENFEAQGKSVEDAEEEVGFPRGWTDIGRDDIEPHRWQAMRDQADGCLIEREFQEWLGKSLPRPERPPRYDG